MAFDKKAYNVAYNARKRAEREARVKRIAEARRANAAKARAAKAARNGHKAPSVVYTLKVPPRWSMTDGKNIIDLGTAREGIVVAIDGRTVVNLITNP